MLHIKRIRILDDHVYGLIGSNWYYICDGVLDIEVDSICIHIKCESFIPQLKDVYTVILGERENGVAVTKDEYTRRGKFIKHEFYTIKDIVRMSTQKVNSKPEYFGEALKRVRETDIERDWKK